ncbi:GNAT family N-acetyltransferase [Actinoplanes sp. NBRC 103695]|uniref:GNAT family N-acetyltransferase n=1 Tax=Actinoplanes sp. NBRC 103695 TaxID=3032202 RepID=UPI0024A206B7|nr:GNAT family N-acetyltransferase [Actinoplanes sp. NBRC 103695]GLZ00759.1 N-acetyltransferase [Actinoplanes sp. NBRC 103695]
MITFRHAEPGDLSTVADLMIEVERFYGTEEFPPRQDWERDIKAALFDPFPAARVLLAMEAAEALGLASYNFLWPAAGVSRSLFLKELYVRDPHRRRGIGIDLMSRLHTIAIDSGCSRVEWQTDALNIEAQMFYKKLGVAPMADKITYRSNGADLGRISQLRQHAE